MAKPFNKAWATVSARRKSFDSLSKEAQKGRKRPGSMNRHKQA